MSVRIERVDGRRGVSRFIDVAWRIPRGPDSLWIPPLRLVVRDLLDQKGNPFYEEAERALFVAERDGRPVGRIAAIENRWHNRHHSDRVGFFGFFDCIDDQEVADALLATAEGWLAERSLDVVRGPMSPSMNHECGLLVDGFEEAPVLMTPWNPPYHTRLIEGAGYGTAQDLLGYDLPGDLASRAGDRIGHLAERLIARSRLTFRELDVSRLKDEARMVHDLYNDAWSGNWGFVPPSWDEFWHSAKDLKPVLAPGFSFIVESEGEAVGFIMVARDLNEVLRRIPDGRLWPWNAARLLFGLKNVVSGRIVLLGLRDGYRRKGLFPVLAYELARRSEAIGAERAEASWILDDNSALTDPLDAIGAKPYKRWRIYERALPER